MRNDVLDSSAIAPLVLELLGSKRGVGSTARAMEPLSLPAAGLAADIRQAGFLDLVLHHLGTLRSHMLMLFLDGCPL
jgi:hypothetical protein